MREQRREYVGAADADFVWSSESPVPASVLWQYFVDADKRLRWQTNQLAVENRPNERGRFGVGATSHCAHGGFDLVRRYVDWRPFRYYTCKAERVKASLSAPPPWTETQEFVPLEGGGTAVHIRIRFHNRGRLSLLWTRLVMAPLIRRLFRRFQANLQRLGEEEELLAQFAPQPSPDAGHSEP